MKKPKIKVPRIRVYSFMLLALLALLALSAYTTILQGMYNDSILENTVQENNWTTPDRTNLPWGD